MIIHFRFIVVDLQVEGKVCGGSIFAYYTLCLNVSRTAKRPGLKVDILNTVR